MQQWEQTVETRGSTSLDLTWHSLEKVGQEAGSASRVVSEGQGLAVVKEERFGNMNNLGVYIKSLSFSLCPSLTHTHAPHRKNSS